MSEDDKSICLRLDEIRRGLFGTKAEMGRRMGMSAPNVQRLFGDPEAVRRNLARIGESDSRIDLNWLLRGEPHEPYMPESELRAEVQTLRSEVRFLREEVLKRLVMIEECLGR